METSTTNQPSTHRCHVDKKDFGTTYQDCLLDRGWRQVCRWAIEHKGIKTKEQCEHWRTP